MKLLTLKCSVQPYLLVWALWSLNIAHAAQPEPDTPLAAQQQIVINNGAEATTLDPIKSEGVPESSIILNLLEGLVTTDNRGHIVPGVASSWHNQQNRIWTFTLRTDARWSDGEPVTAEDFVYSWRRLATPANASHYASYLEQAHINHARAVINGEMPVHALGIKALDKYHLQVSLSEPVPYFLAMTTHTVLKPVNRKAIEKWGDKWTLPAHYVSNGAYILHTWLAGKKIVLQRNPYYWDNARTMIELATFLPLVSASEDVERYMANDIDISDSGLPPEMFATLKSRLGPQVRVIPFLCTFYYEINNQRPPFQDVRVREALKLSLDRQTIAGKLMAQGQVPAWGFTPPYTDGADLKVPDWFRLSQQARNQRARQLLQEAGYGPHRPLTFSLLYNDSDMNQQQVTMAAEMWQKNLAAVVRPDAQPWKKMLEIRRTGKYDVARATWCSDYNEPSSFLNVFLSDSGTNTAFYQSEKFDGLMKNSLEVSDARRPDIYQQAEQQLDRDSALIPVYYRVSARLVKPWVGGFSGQDPRDALDIKYFYITAH
ncbi:oligopeptide ABC transporter substrate-binding protein OppA [Erwinia sp. OLTSP20]|uniref:ABC transporter substrate-binding protein n=1 Tax=unclassified Erwinia TaxID=2622719 RepID=UPI000C1A166C|nr:MULTISPECIES: ABC transporter substrate-binding protein [unclassified Erwinia]PIJ51653.1 oligopeptide ABC transporter substrate-binding protein OppA [Erwinia sp. OAMSP11]PIJ75540.1 oligopeptide ABC transporter substrate-binding protein OppA [Erwinia sp. OLSSP12]PIJ84844.1 oligopeptide ABC transporter substrate-binding protein OppA [Erwinia sp. OLCASP19]PIJ86623.1 oligopeptide ABC transporter substrate-binding protein OppA [Erwinia sp. OLMTSP26]PIJ88064.1 oligopeptide ABC transporter substra